VATLWDPITERVVGDVVILDLRSRGVTLGEGGDNLIAKIRELVNRGRIKILLNLLDVPYVDSFGLEEIVNGFKAVRDVGGELALCNVVARIRDLLVVTKLHTIIASYGSEQEALQGLRQRWPPPVA
jgi:anti-anti-sigma factor